MGCYISEEFCIKVRHKVNSIEQINLKFATTLMISSSSFLLKFPHRQWTKLKNTDIDMKLMQILLSDLMKHIQLSLCLKCAT